MTAGAAGTTQVIFRILLLPLVLSLLDILRHGGSVREVLATNIDP